MTVRPMVNLNDLTREFFSATLSRAHGIRRDGKIGSFSWSEDDRVALPKVRVSKRETYEQEIELYSDGDDVIIEGFCSYPVGYNCKHVAAVLIELFESRLSRRALTVAPPKRSGFAPVIQSQTATPAPSLSKALDTWLSKARSCAAGSPGFSTNPRRLYRLSLVWEGDKREVRLKIYAGRLKDGSYYDVSRYSRNLVGSDRAQVVRQDDVQMLFAPLEVS